MGRSALRGTRRFTLSPYSVPSVPQFWDAQAPKNQFILHSPSERNANS